MNDMSSRMGLKSSKHSQTSLPDPSLPFSAAGILFSNETHVLAGYQPHKSTPCITGIGGTRNEGEYALQTAWRETLEELFGWNTISSKLITLCETNLLPKLWFSRGEYICFQYSFDDLKKLLQLVKHCHISTPLYQSIPTTILELVFNRKILQTSEVHSLCLVPFVREANGPLLIHEEFCMDMEQLSFHKSANI